MPDLQKHNLKKTRFAPTPSGFLHLGNLHNFILIKELAEKFSARIMLRIDDMDRERIEREYIEDVFETLEFMNLHWDEGPRNLELFEEKFSQVHRMNLYEQALDKLKQKEMVYACSCSRSQILHENPLGIYAGTCRDKNIPLDQNDVCWRLRCTDKEVTMKIFNNAPVRSALPAEMKDFIVRKKDGDPAYQLTSVVDDVHFGIDFIVRGEDLWNSSLAQLYLAEVLNLESFGETVFHHHKLLKDDKGRKLSKTAGAISIHYLRKQNKTAEDIRNLLRSYK